MYKKTEEEVEKQGARVFKQLEESLEQYKLSDAEKDQTINELSMQVENTQFALQKAKASLESLRLSAENNENKNKSFLDMAQAKLKMANSEKQMIESDLQNRIDLLETELDLKNSFLREALEAVSTKESELKIIQEQVIVVGEEATANENRVTNLEKKNKIFADEIRKLEMHTEEKSEKITLLQHKLLHLGAAAKNEVDKYQEQIVKLNDISKEKESEVANCICELEVIVDECRHTKEIITLDNSKLNDIINEMKIEVKQTVELKDQLNKAHTEFLMIKDAIISMVHRHDQELELLQQELLEFRQDMETVVNEHTSGLRLEKEDAVKCLAEKETAVECLEVKLRECNETIQKLQGDCSLHEQTKESLRSEVKTLLSRVKEDTTKQNELDDLCQEIERKSAQHADDVKGLKTIEVRLKDREKTINAMTKSSMELEEKVKRLDSEKEKLENQLNDLRCAETSAAQKQNFTLQELEDRDKTIDAMITSSLQQKKKAEKIKAENDNLDNQLMELQDSNEILGDLVGKLQMEKNKLEDQLTKTRSMNEVSAKIVSVSLKESQKEVTFLEAELLKVHSLMTNLIGEKRLFESKVTKEKDFFQKEPEEKKSQIYDLEGCVENLNKAGDKIDNLTARLNERSKAALSLSDKARTLEQKVVSLKSEIITLRKRKDHGESFHESERLRRQSKMFAGQMTEQDEEIKSLISIIESRDRECDALKKNLFTSEKKLKAKSGVHDDDVFAALQFEVQVLQNENMLLEREKQTLKKKIVAANIQIHLLFTFTYCSRSPSCSSKN